MRPDRAALGLDATVDQGLASRPESPGRGRAPRPGTDAGLADGPGGQGAGPAAIAAPGVRFARRGTEPGPDYDHRLRRAVRVIYGPAAADPRGRDRFVAGAMGAARIDHPGVACVLDCGVTDDGRGYYVVPVRRGEPLAGKIAELDGAEDPFPLLARLLSGFEQICRGVAHAHDQRVAHGALGADAMWVGPSGEAWSDGWQGAAADAEPAAVGADVRALGAVLAAILVAVRRHQRSPELEAACERAVRDRRASPGATARDLGGAVRAYLEGHRDHQLRRRMAAAHLARAERAADADVALAEARRALVIDPSHQGAAAMVGGSLLVDAQAPSPEIRAAVDEAQRARVAQVSRYVQAVLLAFAAYALALAGLGIRSWPGYVALLVMPASLYTCLHLQLGKLQWSWWLFGLGLVLVAVFARIVGPFVAAPAEAALLAFAILFYPRLPRRWFLVPLLTTPIVGPWLLEQLGVLATTTTTEPGRIVVRSAVVAMPAVATEVMVATAVTAVVIVGGLLAWAITGSLRAAQRELIRRSCLLERLAPPSARRTGEVAIHPPGAGGADR